MTKITWINVKKETPKTGKPVLAICGGTVMELSFDDGLWQSDNKKFHVSAVTHWALLNKPRVKKQKRIEFKPGKSAMLMNPGFETFKSPVDGAIISCPSKLREHNKKNGVTNIADYEPGHFEKRGKEMAAEASGQTPQAKHERKQLIDKTLHDYGV